ncbi:hypothetical protein OPT61_g3682 [Boeremia exigua]|uniref:Uncharacterized protein n=1 Tax=Boeremia exigua TaxID=749465 RepID=A0ACC2IGX2_9PLEO|nr:hypothetical protein OPT61_g3682 [Boeremia exigua]
MPPPAPIPTPTPPSALQDHLTTLGTLILTLLTALFDMALVFLAFILFFAALALLAMSATTLYNHIYRPERILARDITSLAQTAFAHHPRAGLVVVKIKQIPVHCLAEGDARLLWMWEAGVFGSAAGAVGCASGNDTGAGTGIGTRAGAGVGGGVGGEELLCKVHRWSRGAALEGLKEEVERKAAAVKGVLGKEEREWRVVACAV